MAHLLLYSTNPWITLEIGRRYRHGKYVVWCSEYYDPGTADLFSAASKTAPSACPKGIFDNLARDCDHEDRHSALIRRYRTKYMQLAKTWLEESSIDSLQHQAIISDIKSFGWAIWQPVLFVIPKAAVMPASRIFPMAAKYRAAYGPEFQIRDLDASEFEVIGR